MATLITPISGPFLGTWGGYVLGTQDDDGYNLSCTVQGQEVNRSDAYGETLIEGIYRGQNWKLGFRGLEWKSQGMISAHQSFGLTTGQPAGNLNPTLTPNATPPVCNVGDAMTTYAKVLLLTAILPSSICIPTTLTATFAGLTPNSQIMYNLTSKLREMPLEFVLYPYTATISAKTYIIPFSTT
jgi:hypothetical protein